MLSIYILTILIQVFFNYEINDITFFSCLILVVFYFTIESQDFKLLDENKSLRKSNFYLPPSFPFLIRVDLIYPIVWV